MGPTDFSVISAYSNSAIEGGIMIPSVPPAASEPAAFREAAGHTLHQLGPRLRALRNDPALQELMADPEVQSALQSGDTLALLSHPGFRQLVASVAADPGT